MPGKCQTVYVYVYAFWPDLHNSLFHYSKVYRSFLFYRLILYLHFKYSIWISSSITRCAFIFFICHSKSQKIWKFYVPIASKTSISEMRFRSLKATEYQKALRPLRYLFTSLIAAGLSFLGNFWIKGDPFRRLLQSSVRLRSRILIPSWKSKHRHMWYFVESTTLGVTTDASRMRK